MNKNNLIVIFSPNKKAIEIANKDPKKYLFREKVNADKAILQHKYFIKTLKQQGQKYIDISNYISKNTPHKYFCNLLFTRDSFIKTPLGIILGNMKESIRNYECKIMEKIMKKFNQPILYKCKNGEKLEEIL